MGYLYLCYIFCSQPVSNSSFNRFVFISLHDVWCYLFQGLVPAKYTFFKKIIFLVKTKLSGLIQTINSFWINYLTDIWIAMKLAESCQSLKLGSQLWGGGSSTQICRSLSLSFFHSRVGLLHHVASIFLTLFFF